MKLSDDVVINKIHLVRTQKVMLDKDLAELSFFSAESPASGTLRKQAR